MTSKQASKTRTLQYYPMAQEMRGFSFRSLAASRLAPIKDYIAQHGPQPWNRETLPAAGIGSLNADSGKQSWTQFASPRLSKRSSSESDAVAGAEKIVVLPGWASRRYRAELPAEPSEHAGAPYDVEVFVSGYVVKHKARNTLSRSQRTLLRLAKLFASLPKLPTAHDSRVDGLPNEGDALSESIDELSPLAAVMLPPRPDEIIDEAERDALHDLREELAKDFNQLSTTSSSGSTFEPSSSSISTFAATFSREQFRPLRKTTCRIKDGLSIQRWHANLESRLHPFWAGALPNRTVQVSVRPHHDHTGSASEYPDPREWPFLEQPLATQEVVTDLNGAFKLRFLIPWESLCTHPKGAPIAFVDPKHEHDFSVMAELIPLPASLNTLQTPPGRVAPTLPLDPTTVTVDLVPLTYSPIRVISDIDDTVKLSGVHCGARAVFQNVFVRDLHENLIPGMGEWYSEMWRRGVRFHYVSNGPFELLPVISDFFQLAQLPTGSVRLRSYGTRTLFSGLLSPAADRKRDGVLEVLTSFPKSRFILIGDSGEQDLELYASVAHDHPEKILAIFIRDVNTYEDGGGGVGDPTGCRARSGFKRSSISSLMSRGSLWSPKSSTSSQLPQSPSSRTTSGSTPTDDYFFPRATSPPSSPNPPQKRFTDVLYSEPLSDDKLMQATSPPTIIHTSVSPRSSVSESERKRMNLQMRLWKARVEVPGHIDMRVFCEPQECVESSFRFIDPYLAGDNA